MPYKDPEARKAWRKRWKERTRESGYNQWLYARRKLRFDDAEAFREALQMIAAMPTSERNPDGDEQAADSMKLVAMDALIASAERELEVGLPPSTHVKPTPGGDTLTEALAKLGLK